MPKSCSPVVVKNVSQAPSSSPWPGFFCADCGCDERVPVPVVAFLGDVGPGFVTLRGESGCC